MACTGTHGGLQRDTLRRRREAGVLYGKTAPSAPAQRFENRSTVTDLHASCPPCAAALHLTITSMSSSAPFSYQRRQRRAAPRAARSDYVFRLRSLTRRQN